MNTSLQVSPSFGNVKKQVANNAIKKFNTALEIAYKNPKAYQVAPCQPEEGKAVSNFVEIVRRCGGNIRRAKYNVRTGELESINRKPYHSDKWQIYHDTKGNFYIADNVKSKGLSTGFESFNDFINYFREKIPEINK